MKIWIASLPGGFLRRTREEGLDDLGQPIERLIAEGGEPCRDVLRRARPGEALILASHTPFTQSGPFREFGPVYLLAEASGEEVRCDRLPLPPGDETTYFGQRFVLRAYSAEQRIVAAELAEAEAAQSVMEALLSRPDTAYLQARFPTYGCFACRIERAP